MVVAGEKGLPLVQDQGEVLVFEGAKLEKEIVALFDAEFPPLLGVDTMKKCSSGLMGYILQNGKQGMVSEGVHKYLL